MVHPPAHRYPTPIGQNRSILFDARHLCNIYHVGTVTAKQRQPKFLCLLFQL